MRWEAYEDNAGMIHLVIMDEDYTPQTVYANMEEAPGSLREAIEQLQEDPAAWECWDGGETPVNGERYGMPICWGHDTAIAYTDPEYMGPAARRALGLPADIGKWNGEAWDCSADDEPSGYRMLRPVFGKEVMPSGAVEYPIIGFYW